MNEEADRLHKDFVDKLKREQAASDQHWEPTKQLAEAIQKSAELTKLFNIVDVFILPSIKDSQDEMQITLICEKDKEKVSEDSSELVDIINVVHGLIENIGLKPSAIETARISIASKEEIDKAGGGFNFFRG